MSRRSDVAFSIWDELQSMLDSLRVDSEVACMGESFGAVRKEGRLSKAGLIWAGSLTIDGQPYTVGSTFPMTTLQSRVLVHDKRDDPDKVVDFLVEPKPRRAKP